MPVDATAPDAPTLGYLLEYWSELAAARPGGFSSVVPISFTELSAWCCLTGRTLAPNEVELVRRIDSIFCSVMNAKDG